MSLMLSNISTITGVRAAVQVPDVPPPTPTPTPTPTPIPQGTTSLLLHMDTVSFVDSSANNVALLSNTNVTQGTANKKFGTSSAYFGTTSSALKYKTAAYLHWVLRPSLLIHGSE